MIEFSKPSSRRAPILLALTVLIAALVPIAAKVYLKADIGFFPLALIILAVAGPSILNRFHDGEYRLLRSLSAAAVSILALCVLVGILITPLSAYIFWFDSVKSGFPQGEVGTIFVLLITLFAAIVAPLAWKMGILWPFFALSIVVFYLLAVIIQTTFYIVILLLLLGGASSYYIVRKAKGSAGLANALFAVVLIVIASIGAAMIPGSSQGNGSTLVSDIIHPALRKTVTRVFPSFSLLYAVPGYGMSFDETRLGARPNLVDDPLFEIEGASGERLYLRTRVFDNYNGTAWSMSSTLTNRHFDRESAGDFLTKLRKPREELLSLLIMSNNFSFIPYTLNTKRVYIEGEYPPLKGGNPQTGFGLAGPFQPGTKIFLERYPRGESPSDVLEPAVRAGYLQIPEDLPQALRNIAAGLARETSSKAEILAKTEAFLAHNYSYNLDVEEYLYDQESDPRDFAYSFLFNETGGYCVHFATSFILLARLSGVPARYATGYLAGIPSDKTKAVVTGFSAHAWPEVWLDGIGWINWEATPAADAGNYTVLGDEWFYNLSIELNAITAAQLEGLLGEAIADTGQSSDRGARGAFPVGLVFIILGSVAGAALLAVFSIRVAYPALRNIADRRGRLYHGMKRLSKRLERKGIPGPATAGWLAWGDGVKSLISTNGNGDGALIDGMIRVLLGITYGGQECGPETTLYFDAFRKHVREELKNRNRLRDY